ncbi:zinc ribbon domain-containing protein [Clostridium butyricum]
MWWVLWKQDLHSNSKYRKVVWRCNHKYDNNEKCKTSHIYEDKLKELFVKAFNEMIENKDEILKNYKEIIEVLGDTSKLEKEKLQLENEAEVLVELLRKHVERNAHSALNQEEYESKYNELANKYDGVKNRVEEVEKKIFSQKIKFNNKKEFIERLEKCDKLITEFDEELWNATIYKVTVVLKGNIKFYFSDGKKVEVYI